MQKLPFSQLLALFYFSIVDPFLVLPFYYYFFLFGYAFESIRSCSCPESSIKVPHLKIAVRFFFLLIFFFSCWVAKTMRQLSFAIFLIVRYATVLSSNTSRFLSYLSNGVHDLREKVISGLRVVHSLCCFNRQILEEETLLFISLKGQGGSCN